MPERVARLTLVALVALSAVSTDLYLSGIPQIVRDLGVGHAEGQLTLSTYMLGFALGQLVFGPLSDYFGRKPVVAAGLVLYVAASLACALAGSIGSLLWARCIHGIAAASGPVVARAIVRDRYHAAEAARMMSLLAAAMAVVPLIAPILGSWLLYWFDWRAQFLLMLCFGVLVLGGLRSLSESSPSIGVGGITLRRVFVQFGECLRNRRFLGYQLAGGAAFAAMFTYISSASFIVIELLGLAPQHFGYTFMLAVSGYMGGSLLSSRLVSRFGIQRMIGIGVVIAVLGALLLGLLALLEINRLSAVILAVFLCFAGSGMSLANAQMGAISEYPLSAGAASSVFGFLQTAMAALAGYIVGHAYDGTLAPTALTMLGAMAVAITGALLLRRHGRASEVPPA